jgi:hypothetical protein
LIFDAVCSSNENIFESIYHNTSDFASNSENEYIMNRICAIEKNLYRKLDEIEPVRLEDTKEQNVDEDMDNNNDVSRFKINTVSFDSSSDFVKDGIVSRCTSFGGCSRGSIKSQRRVTFIDDYLQNISLISSASFESKKK